jgi:hypothetical protein
VIIYIGVFLRRMGFSFLILKYQPKSAFGAAVLQNTSPGTAA